MLAPADVDALPALVAELRADDGAARAVAAAGEAWAGRELTRRAAWCYWAYLVDRLSALQRRGGALASPGRPPGDPLGDMDFREAQPSRTRPCFCPPGEDGKRPGLPL